MKFDKLEAAIKQNPLALDIDITGVSKIKLKALGEMIKTHCKSLVCLRISGQANYLYKEALDILTKYIEDSPNLIFTVPNTGDSAKLADRNYKNAFSRKNIIKNKKSSERALAKWGKADYQNFNKELPSVCAALIYEENGLGSSLKELPDKFVPNLQVLAKGAGKHAVDLLELLPDNWQRQVTGKIEQTSKKVAPKAERVVKKKSIKPEDIKIEIKPRISPHEIRERLLARRGVTLGFVDFSDQGVSR